MMLSNFHLIRPYWLLTLIPFLLMLPLLWKERRANLYWQKICDPHLLQFLLQKQQGQQRRWLLISISVSLFLMIIALTGPSWKRLPVPVFHVVEPRVLVLNLSDSMLKQDISPSRLQRAKFKIKDLLEQPDRGQWGMLVYTGQPFLVSPLTEDGRTISALLPSLTPDIMPVSGQNMGDAIKMAGKLIKQAGFKQGQILVLSDFPPDNQALEAASHLSKHEAIHTSIMPVLKSIDNNPIYQKLAIAGDGQLLPVSSSNQQLQQWLKQKKINKEYDLNKNHLIPVWQDEGRWFLLASLLFLIPVFRRGLLDGGRL